MENYTVQTMGKVFVNEHKDTYEQYVLVQSSAIKDIFGKKFKEGIDDMDTLDGLVKITNPQNSRPAYRKVRAMSVTGLNKDSVQIAERTINYLGIKEGEHVTISKTNGLCFLWNHPNTAIRVAFYFAVAAFAVTCILAIVLKFI